MKIKYGLIIKVIFLICILFMVSIFYNQISNFFKTTALVTQLLPSVPVKPLKYFSDPPVWEKIEYTAGDSIVKADLILPATIHKNGNPAILLSLGVAVNEPTNDVRLINLAEALSRLGIIVLIPWTETQKTHYLSSEYEVDALVNGFKYLESLPETKSDSVGIMGYCTGASMGLIAAADKRIRNDVRYVVAFAGYHDLKNFSKSILSNTAYLDSTIREWQPDPFAVNLVKRQIINSALPEKESEIFSNIDFSKTTLSDLKSLELSPSSDSVINLLFETDYSNVSRGIEKFPQKTQKWLEYNSPSYHNIHLLAPVFIMHDRADNIVPFEESKRMYNQISMYVPTEITIFDLFSNEIQLHEDESVKNNQIDLLSNALKLFSQLNSIIRVIFSN